MQLEALGWDSHFGESYEQYRDSGLVPARVAEEHKSRYVVYAEGGEFTAEVSGRFRFEAGARMDMPAVGDWVAVRPFERDCRAMIHALLPRKSAFLRKVAWVRTESQVLAANVDIVFLVMGLARNFSLRRMERFLTLGRESGAVPVVVLNKRDLCEDIDSRLEEVESIALGVPVHAISALEGGGVEELRAHMGLGRTAALLGSSGVGKSTIINRLLGAERQTTRPVREADGRGRHVTSSRQLIMLPEGGMIVDTPGMRELQLWAEGDGLKSSFDDIEALAGECRFRDCNHETEPGCAVRRAIEDGELEAGRLKSYRKLQREIAVLAARKDQRARLDQRAKQKELARRIWQHQKHTQKWRQGP
jgi:ribosome biogenesis GTPase